MRIEKSNHINLKKRDLKKLSKSELINLLLKQEKKKPEIIIVDDYKPVPAPRTNKKFRERRRPIPTPRKSVKQMVKQYEENIILPPPEFRNDYKPVPAPRSKQHVVKKPVPTPRTNIEQTKNASKGYTKSYEISIKNNKDPLKQLTDTSKAIEFHIKKQLDEMKGFKYFETLKVTFEKQSGDEIISNTAYFNSTPQTIINHADIANSLQ